MWYSNSYRRHLCDMHIDDWDERFMSEFDPEEYVEDLLRANIQNAIIHIVSHAGVCYYPSKVGDIHKAFIGKEDAMRRVEELCHQHGITVTGYYSLNYNTREHDKHPEWRMLHPDGKSTRERGTGSETDLAFASPKQARYGHCCPNNKGYQEFVFQQIDEILEYFHLDGMFFDMPYWAYVCYCDTCKSRWMKEVGGEIPVKPELGSPEHLQLLKKKHQWMGEFIQSVTDHVKSVNPNVSVEHNFAAAITGSSNMGCGEEVNAASDFVGGDLYGNTYYHSVAAKFYKNITKNAPFEYMFSRCKPGLRTHTMTKTLDEMRTDVMITAAHHGATMSIDAVDPIGTVDARVYERIGQVFAEQEPYEPYFTGKMREDVGVYYSMRSRCKTNGEEYNNKLNVCAVAENLIHHNIPFGITGNFHDIEACDVLIYPCVNSLEEADNERILKYVANGGNLYISGAENPKLLETLLDCKVVGRTKEDQTYIGPIKEMEALFLDFNQKYPLMFQGTAPIIELKDNSSVMAYIVVPYTTPDDVRFAAIHSNPPGVVTEIPAVVMKNYGKGKVIWSGLCIEALSIYEYKEVVMNLIGLLKGDSNYSCSSDAPEYVEMTVFDNEHSTTVNLVDMREQPIAKEIESFEIRIKTDKMPKKVVLLPEGTEISFLYEHGETYFVSEHLRVFDMYEIQY